MTREEIRLECVKTTLAACTRADIQRDEGLSFAEKVFDFVMKAPDTTKKETPRK
jgi:hypothetical protein